MKSGPRSNTTKDMTSTERRTWLSEEIVYINDLMKHLRILFNENLVGQMDKHRVMANLFVAETYLNRYVSISQNSYRQKINIYQLANFRRNENKTKRYSVTEIKISALQVR